MPDSPVAISELGIAYFVQHTVARVEPGSPAAESGLQAGDRITKAKVIPPSKEQLDELRKKYHDDDLEQSEVTLPSQRKKRNWPFFMLDLQGGLPGTTVEFTWQRGDKEMTGKAAPAPGRELV